MSDLGQWAAELLEQLAAVETLAEQLKALPPMPTHGELGERLEVLRRLRAQLGGETTAPSGSATAMPQLRGRLDGAVNRSIAPLRKILASINGEITRLEAPDSSDIIATAELGAAVVFMNRADGSGVDFVAVRLDKLPLGHPLGSVLPDDDYYRGQGVRLLVLGPAYPEPLTGGLVPGDFYGLANARALTRARRQPQRRSEQSAEEDRQREAAERRWEFEQSSAGRERALRQQVAELQTQVNRDKAS